MFFLFSYQSASEFGALPGRKVGADGKRPAVGGREGKGEGFLSFFLEEAAWATLPTSR